MSRCTFWSDTRAVEIFKRIRKGWGLQDTPSSQMSPATRRYQATRVTRSAFVSLGIFHRCVSYDISPGVWCPLMRILLPWRSVSTSLVCREFREFLVRSYWLALIFMYVYGERSKILKDTSCLAKNVIVVVDSRGND